MEDLQPAYVQNQIPLNINTMEIWCLTVAAAQCTQHRNPRYQPHISTDLLLHKYLQALGI